MNPESSSRRSFVKKSLVASVLVAQPTLLAGLVRATGGGEETGTGTGDTTVDQTTHGLDSTVPVSTGFETTIGATTVVLSALIWEDFTVNSAFDVETLQYKPNDSGKKLAFAEFNNKYIAKSAGKTKVKPHSQHYGKSNKVFNPPLIFPLNGMGGPVTPNAPLPHWKYQQTFPAGSALRKFYRNQIP